MLSLFQTICTNIFRLQDYPMPKRFQYGSNECLRGFVQVVRVKQPFEYIRSCMKRNHASYAIIRGELLTLHDSPIHEEKKRFTLTDAKIKTCGLATIFSVKLNGKKLRFTCDSPLDAERWMQAIHDASQRAFEKFYIIGPIQLTYPLGTTHFCYYKNDQESDMYVEVIPTKKGSNPFARKCIEAERRACLILNSKCIDLAHDMFQNATEAYLVKKHSCFYGTVRWVIECTAMVEDDEAESFSYAVALSVLCGLKDMHANFLAHRNVRPENILVHEKGIMLSGLAANAPYTPNLVDDNVFDSRLAYSKEPYAAPEIMYGQKYGPAADIWAFGAMLYDIICGKVPTSAKTRKFGERGWENVSVNCRSFIKQLLCFNIRNRPTAAAALQHDWIKSNAANIPPHTECLPQSNSFIALTPTMLAIEKHGLAYVKRRSPQRYELLLSSNEAKAYLSSIFKNRRILLKYSRAMTAVFRMMTTKNGVVEQD